MVQTPGFHRRGHGFDPWSRNEMPHAATKMQCSEINNKKKRKQEINREKIIKATRSCRFDPNPDNGYLRICYQKDVLTNLLEAQLNERLPE